MGDSVWPLPSYSAIIIIGDSMASDVSGNSNRFIIFSTFFTARAYYPVLAILFLDLGLKLEQFVLLNLIWAITIFAAEVPSGALADTMGRRKLLITASALMTLEMLCLLLAPRNGGALLLTFCVINRIASGLSEACASGANEALAYDSLAEKQRAQAWDALLARAMRWRSIGFVVAMIIGGLLYDPKAINYLLPESLALSVDIAHRLPIIIVLAQALICLWITWRMVEPERLQSASTIKQTIKLTLVTARWVFNQPILVVAITIGVAIDSIVRNFATLDSRYYRLIEIPEWSYGFIGASIGAIGIVVPTIAKHVAQQFGLLTNLSLIAICAFLGLSAIAPAWPFIGVLPVMFLMSMMGFLEFSLSRVLHQQANSAQRATVLSVKGLVFNLGYGLFSLGFAGLLANLPDEPSGSALRGALTWQLPYFAVIMIGLFMWGKVYLARNTATS